MSFGTDASGERAKPKAWKEIWGSGQGVGSVGKIVPAAELIARFKREYDEAVDPAAVMRFAATNASHDRRLFLRRDPLRDRVVSAAALHLQLHGLPDRVGQRVCAQHAGLAKDFHLLKGEPKPWHHTSPTGVAVISWFCGDCGGRTLRRPRRARRNCQPSCRHARRYLMAGTGGAYVT